MGIETKFEKFPEKRKEVGIKEELRRELTQRREMIREALKDWKISELPFDPKDTENWTEGDFKEARIQREENAFRIFVHMKTVKAIEEKKSEITELLKEDLWKRIEGLDKEPKKFLPDRKLKQLLTEKFKQEFPEKENKKEEKKSVKIKVKETKIT